MAPETAEAHLAMYLLELDASLKSAQFLFGAKPVLADFSVYHCLWLVANNPTMVTLLEPYPNVTAWRARMAAFGHGNFTEISAEQALEVARKATPAPIPKSTPLLPPGFALGQQASIVPTDYGLFPVSGELVVCNAHEYAVRRRDPTAGEIVTHFPRQGFVLTR
jgi:hypothetical protein